MRTAILVDGDFFLHRFRRLQGGLSPSTTAQELHRMCRRHLASRNPDEPKRDLYRIFYYDCPPLMKKMHHPLTHKAIDYSKTDTARWRLEFFEQLKTLRKVALRLGDLSDAQTWALRPDAMKQVLAGKLTHADLRPEHIALDIRQKGVDMRLGIDIASLVYKKQVDQIVLVAGDSDFVPAAKLARREGIDFVLDPMWARIRSDLHEHIDGLRSVIPRPGTTADESCEAS